MSNFLRLLGTGNYFCVIDVCDVDTRHQRMVYIPQNPKTPKPLIYILYFFSLLDGDNFFILIFIKICPCSVVCLEKKLQWNKSSELGVALSNSMRKFCLKIEFATLKSSRKKKSKII